jgi:hypothetical protein
LLKGIAQNISSGQRRKSLNEWLVKRLMYIDAFNPATALARVKVSAIDKVLDGKVQLGVAIAARFRCGPSVTAPCCGYPIRKPPIV